MKSSGVKKIAFFLLLSLLVILSQIVLLQDHLKYGFSDVDWGFLTGYKTNRQASPDIFTYFIKSLKTWGVYNHQEYYIGLQSEFFGLNFQSYQITTHVFKTLAIISAYPLFLSLTGSALAAFTGVILFALSYAAAGTMYTVVTSSDYFAVFSMVIFFLIYSFIVKKGIKSLYWNIIALFSLLLTLFLSTERMYPILFFLVAIEAFLILYNKFSKAYLKAAASRMILLLSPLILAAVFAKNAYSSFIFLNGGKLAGEVLAGGWNNLLRPFISMGSLIVPAPYWQYFGIVKMQNFNAFLIYFVTGGPLVVFTIMTCLLGYSVFKYPLRFILQMTLVTLLLGIAVFVISTNSRLQFDETVITPALIGGYIVSLGIFFLIYWIKNKQKDSLLICAFSGILFTFFYLVLTWIASDLTETPTGAHRYLTIPSLLISFAMGSIFILAFKKLKNLSFVLLLLLIPMMLIWSAETKNFFSGQLKMGFGVEDKQMMKSQLLSYLNNLSKENQSLIYFDFSEDMNNAYYYDNTLLGGFRSWILWENKNNLKPEFAPFAIWSRFDQLAAAKEEKDGTIGFRINNEYYSLENFYAFKLKDKKVYNIKDDILKKLEISKPLNF